MKQERARERLRSSEKSSVSFEPKNARELAEFFRVIKEEFHEFWIVLTKKEYANPQPDQPIFAQTWPGLIAANNEAHAKGFLHNKPAPGTNSSLVLNNAVLTIPGGKIVASINSGLYSGCHLGSLSQDTDAHAFSCPARVTVYVNGQAHTIDAGYLCRVGGDTPNSAAHMAYDEKTRVLHFYATIGGKPVPLSNTDEPCDRTLSLAQQ